MKIGIVLIIFISLISGFSVPNLDYFHNTLVAKVIKRSKKDSRPTIIEKFAERPKGKFWLHELFTSITRNEDYDKRLFVPTLKNYDPIFFEKSKDSFLAKIRASEILKLPVDEVPSKLNKYSYAEQSEIMMILLYSTLTNTSLLTPLEIQKLQIKSITPSEYSSSYLNYFPPVVKLSVLPQIYKRIYYLRSMKYSDEKKKIWLDTTKKFIMSMLVFPDSLVALKFYLFVVKYDGDFIHQEYALESIRTLLRNSHASSKDRLLAPTVWAMEDFIKAAFPYDGNIYNLAEPKRLAVVILAELGLRSTWYVLAEAFDKIDKFGFAAEVIRDFNALVPSHEDVSKSFTKSVYAKIKKAHKQLRVLVKKHVKNMDLSHSIHGQIKDLTFFCKVAFDFLEIYGDTRKSREVVEPFIGFRNVEMMNSTFRKALQYISESAIKFLKKK